MSFTQLRPRTGPELIDASFQLYRAHLVQFAMVTAIMFAPAIVLLLILPQPLTLIGSVVSGITQIIAFAAIVVMVSDAYLGREIQAGPAVRQVLQRFWRVLIASIFQGVLVFIGFILLIVPGFIFFAWAFAMQPAVMLENKGVGAAFSRSRELARGSVGRILLVLLGTYALYWIVWFSVLMLIGFGANMIVADGPAGSTGRFEALGVFLQVFIYPIVAIVATLLYYDLRIRKEAFDLEMMAAELGAHPAITPEQARQATAAL